MWKRGRHHVFMAEAGEGAAAGGAGAAGATGDAAAAGAGSAGQGSGDGAAAGGGAGAGASLLAAGASAGAPAGGAAGAGAGAADPNAWIPEKFRVTKDGALDLEASARKVEEHRSHLEKRLGAGDIPPKSADEYKVNVPAALAEKIKAEDLAKSPGFKDFLGKMHAAGLSQKQVDVAVGEFLDRSMQLQGAMQQLSMDEATGKLKEVWKSDAEFTQNLQAAYRAGQTYAGPDFDGILKDYGNDPRIVKMLAAVGKELAEDTGTPNGGQGITEVDAESLAKSPAYWNPNDPKHAETKAKVEAFYARKYGNTAKQTGSMAFSSSL